MPVSPRVLHSGRDGPRDEYNVFINNTQRLVRINTHTGYCFACSHPGCAKLAFSRPLCRLKNVSAATVNLVQPSLRRGRTLTCSYPTCVIPREVSFGKDVTKQQRNVNNTQGHGEGGHNTSTRQHSEGHAYGRLSSVANRNPIDYYSTSSSAAETGSPTVNGGSYLDSFDIEQLRDVTGDTRYTVSVLNAGVDSYLRDPLLGGVSVTDKTCSPSHRLLNHVGPGHGSICRACSEQKRSDSVPCTRDLVTQPRPAARTRGTCTTRSDSPQSDSVDLHLHLPLTKSPETCDDSDTNSYQYVKHVQAVASSYIPYVRTTRLGSQGELASTVASRVQTRAFHLNMTKTATEINNAMEIMSNGGRRMTDSNSLDNGDSSTDSQLVVNNNSHLDMDVHTGSRSVNRSGSAGEPPLDNVEPFQMPSACRTTRPRSAIESRMARQRSALSGYSRRQGTNYDAELDLDLDLETLILDDDGGESLTESDASDSAEGGDPPLADSKATHKGRPPWKDYTENTLCESISAWDDTTPHCHGNGANNTQMITNNHDNDN